MSRLWPTKPSSEAKRLRHRSVLRMAHANRLFKRRLCSPNKSPAPTRNSVSATRLQQNPPRNHQAQPAQAPVQRQNRGGRIYP